MSAVASKRPTHTAEVPGWFKKLCRRVAKREWPVSRVLGYQFAASVVPDALVWLDDSERRSLPGLCKVAPALWERRDSDDRKELAKELWGWIARNFPAVKKLISARSQVQFSLGFLDALADAVSSTQS